MQLNEDTITTIMYEDSKGDRTARVIIPTSIPSPNMKALDVSHLSAAERVTIAEQYREYREYLDTMRKQLWSFEQWAEQCHPGNHLPSLKWRTFKMSNLIE